jgi:hypothetical protein
LGCPNIISSLTIGPGGAQNFNLQINDAGPSPTYPSAPGVAGPTPDANNLVSGWTLLTSKKIFNPLTGLTSTGDVVWTASSVPGSQFTFSLETLVGPQTQAGTSPDGPMADFDPTQKYKWPFVSWQGTYTGPTDTASLTADTLLDATAFANPHPGTFTIQLDLPNSSLDLVYTPTPVPEPGTLGLVAVGALGVWRGSRRRGR